MNDREEGGITAPLHHDVMIIGAGVCGIYAVYRLTRQGFDVRVIEKNPDVGGTWYRNRYPGCRFDSESYTYGYSFSKELLQEWNWSERFAPREETLRYFQHVTDRFDLRKHFDFEAEVVSAEWNEEGHRWLVKTNDGRIRSTRFLMTAMGLLSIPTDPRYPGINRYQGTAVHTYNWPDGLDITGKKVAVIGTGSTGVQVISAIAKDVEQLTVFQNNPNWCAPLHNSPISPEEMEQIKQNYDEIFRACFESPNGFLHAPDHHRSTEFTREERLAHWEELYQQPGFGIWLGNYMDTMWDEKANAELSEFIAEKIRQRVDDPEVAEKLIPKDHGFGAKRVPLETGYYETYNRDNVELISLKETPIEEFTEAGIRTRTEDGAFRDFELDVIIFATGFDAVTGAFDRIDFTGVDGRTLRDKWANGPETVLGLQTEGFPNLIILVGPQAGSVSANFPRGIEDIVNWATEFVVYLREHGITRVEARREPELVWLQHVKDQASRMLMGRSRSWFNGQNSNLDRDQSPRPLIYTGGAIRYRKWLNDEIQAGYPSFVFGEEDTQRPEITLIEGAAS